MVFTNIIISSKRKKFLCLNQCLFTKFIVRTIKEYFLLEDLKKDYIFLTKVISFFVWYSQRLKLIKQLKQKNIKIGILNTKYS